MTILVTDDGFTKDDPTRWIDPEARRDLTSDTDPETLPDVLIGAELIEVDFPSFADGRGYTLARLIRQHGFQGWLRAKGHVISDQYAMARRSGFDDVAIDDDLATRQTEDQWRFRSEWQSHDYQTRLRSSVAA